MLNHSEYNRTDFGKKLKFFREYVLKMKRKHFCEFFDITTLSVISWENESATISIKQIINMEERLNKYFTNDQIHWLFREPGCCLRIIDEEKIHQTFPPFLENPKNKDQFQNHPTGHTRIVTISTHEYEPIISKNTTFQLDQVILDHLVCPKIIAYEDNIKNLHFGILTSTTNNAYILEAYKNGFYKILIPIKDPIFFIRKIDLS